MTLTNQLLKKFRTGNYSEQELNDLIELLQLPANEQDIELSMNSHWDSCADTAIGDEQRFQHILDEIHHNISLQASKTVQLSWYRKIYTEFSRVAAIIVLPLAIALGFLLVHQHSNNLATLQNTVTVPLGATSEFDLPDGTHIWLNAGSKLTYPMSFANQSSRLVSLNGEGFFKVKKDKKCPFIVKMNEMDIRVTGTTFNARAYSDEQNITVALVEGAVQLGQQTSDGTFEKRSELHPQDVGELNRSNKQLTLSSKRDLTKYTAWTQGVTVFDNDPIQDVTNRLEKLYNVHVVIPDKELLQYRLTATFVNEPLDRALKIISLSSPVNYQIINGKQNANGTYGQRTLILRKANKLR
jgi:Fe2+-dicitrate sensor, membrane component